MAEAAMKNKTGRNRTPLWKRIARNYTCYLFMAPFAAIFIVFVMIPVITAILYSFTSFNVLEPPVFSGWTNYRKLFLEDDLFIIALKNTLTFALILGPGGYLLSLTFAWFINDLSPKFRAFMTLLFYAPALSNIFVIWKIIFSGDDYGILNAYLVKLGITYGPILWLQDPKYMMGAVITVLLWASMGTSFLAFIAGFQTIDDSLYEAGAMDGIKNRWQELWFITLPSIRPQLMFGAIMSISASFGIGDAVTAMVGFPSPQYAAHTVVHHLQDYGFIRFDMGYACAIATLLFLIMVATNKVIQKMLQKVGT